MSANNIVAPGVENLGIRTFSTDEMAINLIGLLTESMTYTACEHPLWADFGGNFDAVNDLKGESDSIRADVMRRAAVARAISSDHAQDRTGSNVDSGVESSTAPPPRAKFDVVGNRWPKLPTESEMPTSTCERLAGMCDLDRTVVITGFGEVGPWGSSRTRWELEAKGKLSLEGEFKN